MTDTTHITDTGGTTDTGPTADTSHLPSDAGPVLIELAREAIGSHLAGRESSVHAATLRHHPWLDHPGASFVTLTRDGQLRGCIGTLEVWRALGRDVVSNAVSAAVRDPRFPALTSRDWPGITVEVSVLSPLQPFEVTSEDDLLATLVPHRDGLVLESGGHRATFLPQVWQTLPTPREFLVHLKRKAGLADSWWDPHARWSRYTVAEFSEHPAQTEQT